MRPRPRSQGVPRTTQAVPLARPAAPSTTPPNRGAGDGNGNSIDSPAKSWIKGSTSDESRPESVRDVTR